jgi:phosphoribosylanthranilate isomerase
MTSKICGITRLEDARHAAACGADFIGLILAPSPRQVPVPVAREIVRDLPAGTPGVLVFRDAPCAAVAAALRETGAGWAQLHGREAPEYLQALAAAQPGVRVIKAFEIGRVEDAAMVAAYLEAARRGGVVPDVILLDVAKGGPHPGYACLREVARTLAARPPRVWCAGGLSAENVQEALIGGAFDGADVAGGVETAPGRKAPGAVAAFLAAVRAL